MGLQPPSHKVTARVPQLFVPRRRRNNGLGLERRSAALAANLIRGRQRMLCFIPGCASHRSVTLNFNFCRTPLFIKDVVRFGTLSSYPPAVYNPSVWNVEVRSRNPVVADTVQGDDSEGNSITTLDERASKHGWGREARSFKFKKEAVKNSLQLLERNKIEGVFRENGSNLSVVESDYSSERLFRSPSKWNRSAQPKISGNNPLRDTEKSLPQTKYFGHKPLRDTEKSLPQNKYLGHTPPRDTEKSLPSEVEKDDDGSSYLDFKQKFKDAEQEEQRQKEKRDRMNKEKLLKLYEKVLIVDTISEAKRVVHLLTTKHKNLIHACDTEVSEIDVKEETPVGHGKIICFSVYSGSQVDYGNGKSCIWVDVLDGENDILMEFAPFFENPTIKKVWHNYSFDSHVIRNYGIDISGFHADTMHLARLWDSSRRTNGGYSLEALTGNSTVMKREKRGNSNEDDLTTGKISMKTLFGKKKVKKDGTEGKLITIASVEMLQREERVPWICYSALDSVSTLKLFESLREKLMERKWAIDGLYKGSMFDFYNEYWRPFGELLTKMEAEGMLVDRKYLAEVEKVAISEQRVAADAFRNWASSYCSDAKYMNVGSDTQIRQLFFGGFPNKKDPDQTLPLEKTFKVPNTEKIIEEGKKAPLKCREITLSSICTIKEVDMCTPSGWPSVSGDALRVLAGKVSFDDFQAFDCNLVSPSEVNGKVNDTSAYGLAFDAFNGGAAGVEACRAIAALCEMCSIDSLISNFIIPLQGNRIAGHGGRIHCSLNINTETGRLSARRPNLQNQPALEKDRYKIRQAFIAAPGNSLIVADYGQLELRILAHMANCKSMLDAFKAGGDFHSRTAMNMYSHVRKAVNEKRVLLEWHPQPGMEKPPVPLLKDAFAAERRKAKMLNFSIAYGKTPVGLARDWKVSVKEAKETVDLWYNDRREVLRWQEARKKEAREKQQVHTLLGRARKFPSVNSVSNAQKGHIERAAINTPVQGSAADVAMCAMLEIAKNKRLKELGWKLLLQVHDEVILEGPTESSEEAKAIVVDCMSKPFNGKNTLRVDLSVDAKCAPNWYAGK